MNITPEQIATITDVDMAFGTTKFLPKYDELPKDFVEGNIYTELAEAIFFGSNLPEGNVEMKPGFTPDIARRAVMSHLRSWEPKHEHKIAGVGYLISCMSIVEPEKS